MNKLTTVEKLDKKQIEDFFSEALNIEKTWPNLKKLEKTKQFVSFFGSLAPEQNFPLNMQLKL